MSIDKLIPDPDVIDLKQRVGQLETTAANALQLAGEQAQLTAVAAAGTAVEVGLAPVRASISNVDNTSDADKPVSSAQAAALSTKATALKDQITISCGPSGDFPTLNAAIQAARSYYPAVQNKAAKLRILQTSGFVLAEQFFAVQEQLSWIELASEDAAVPVVSAAINQGNGNASGNNWRTGTYPALCAMRGGMLPYINTLYQFDDDPNRKGTVGVYVFEGGRAVVGQGKGVIGAGWRGLYADNGIVYARNSVWRRSGLIGGPDTASFVPGGYAIRVSNNGMAMCRGADASESYTAAYVSKGFADLNGLNARSCADLAIAVTDHGFITVSGAICDGSKSGIRADQGGEVYGGESSEVAGQFTSAAVQDGYALVVQTGAEAAFDQPTFSSTGTNAVLVRNSRLRLAGGSASTTASTRAAVLVDQGGSLTAQASKLEGTTTEVQLADGSLFNGSGNTRADGVTPSRCNVRGGEFSPAGQRLGIDERREVYSANANVALSSTSAPEFFLVGNFTDTRDLSLYDSTNFPWKRHTIVHAGSGVPWSIYSAGKTLRYAVIALGEAVTLEPDGAGGWIVISRSRKPITGRTFGTGATTLTPASQYVRSSGPLNSASTLTMYAASDGAAQAHTISRADAGTGTTTVYEPNGTTIICTLSANQWAQIAPRSDGGAWYVASRGSLA